ncbi:flagellin domain protein [Thermosinus carboxydivorans Nor1]|uniref:Flagellin n=1 Tax=Thermosinus carboxydivorans Nor1 TaxID=401526 RepID=A1HT41_9FIRM|nr:flagellin [Thermosinus carboxydivorans]EAX46805.1 flagellin domain protein [Thermosinus carboxydivorans Nor1]
MIINHNMSALNTYRQLSINNANTSKSLEKLSSGLRINRAGDDAAGLAISEKMRGQIRGLDQAARNAQDGISLIQTAEGALNETHSILQRMRELAVQAASDTNTASDRSELQKEVDQLAQEIGRIGNTTQFNTQKLLDGKFNGTFHIGANENQTLTLSINDMRSYNLGVTGDVTIKETGTLAAGDFADGTYTVAKANDGTYQLLDVTGNIVATSTDAKTYKNVLDTTKTITFTNTVTSGKVIVSGTNADAEATVATANSGLEAGTYTYDATNKVLKDAGGNVVAVSSDGTKFTVGGTNVLDLGSNALADGDTVVIHGVDITSRDAANKAITTIEKALEIVSDERAKMGAYQNRLEHTINNLSTSSENLTAAESRIRDVDMAKEMMNFQKNSILAQAAQAMLAQANQQPQGVLQLLR